MCPKCYMLQPRPLSEKALLQEARPEVAASASKHGHMVPRPEDVPEPLQNLSTDIIEALRPLTIDVGPEVRTDNGGFRKKMRMVTFSWDVLPVDDKVAALKPKAFRKKAKAALKHLLANPMEIEYHDYYNRQKAFLVRCRGEPTPQQARRPLHFIESVGLETALWPHLYWKTTMCESYERLNRQRLEQLEGRRKRRRVEEAGKGEAEAEDPESEGGMSSERAIEAAEPGPDCDDDDQPDPLDRRRSIKRSFQAKLLGPLLGYAADFTLVQYVFDLHLWTDLGSKKGSAGTTAMRLMMAGHPMSPLYWQDVKYGLFDLVAQLGYPQLYWTIAPWEQSLPYHSFMLDEMQKLLLQRTRLAPFEAMHWAHAMFEICRGLLAGHGRAGGQGWKQHALGSKRAGGEREPNNCVQFFTRLEFQDGSRKAGTQRYHGSGRPHAHALFWVRDVRVAVLEDAVAATLDWPAGSENLAAFVRASQPDRDGNSRWPVHEGASKYSTEREQLQVHHTEEDAAEGVRGYFVPIMDALRCHQDLQVAQGRGMLLSYVTKYVAKWSDSSYDEWMSDSASATSLCRKVLFEYHPFEPEMALQLSGATFRQWEFGSIMGGRRSIRAPRPASVDQPEVVGHYVQATWRRDSMSLLEFLRKSDASGKSGRVASWLRKTWEALPNPKESLEAFANEYVLRGEQIVATEYLWRLNDNYYGLWCMMHIPFRSLEVFHVPSIVQKVPLRYRWLATALHLTDDPATAPRHLRGYWRDPLRQTRDMQLEACVDAFIADVVAFVAAQTLAIDRYTDGHLDRAEEGHVEPDGAGPAPAAAAAVTFEGKQKLLYKAVGARVQLCVRAQRATREEEQDALREQARGSAHKPVVCSGRPGAGKTTVVHRNALETLAAGGSVLVAVPTARLSTRMAAKLGSHDRLVVDTVAAAFQLHKPEQEALYAVYGYDLIVVDEFSQLSQQDFERILRHWQTSCLRWSFWATNISCLAGARTGPGTARLGRAVLSISSSCSRCTEQMTRISWPPWTCSGPACPVKRNCAKFANFTRPGWATSRRPRTSEGCCASTLKPRWWRPRAGELP